MEERLAWDQYAAGWIVTLGARHLDEEPHVTAAKYADAMLAERRNRFGRTRTVPRRSGLH
jgi:hypothetical protein